MKKRWLYGMASAAVIALVLTLNLVNPLGKTETVNAMNQTAVKVGENKEIAENIETDEVTVVKETEAEVKTQVEVPVDLEREKGDQKNADAGSSPWKLDPIFVSQVFVSLKMSPEGIQGDYPVKYEELKLVESTEAEAVVEVIAKETTVGKVYLKRLVKQDNSGIWTVVGYDPLNNK